MKTSIRQQEPHEEAQLEPYFHLSLERLTQCPQDGPLLSYMSVAGSWRGTLETIGVSQSDLTHPSQPGIEIRVLTPAIYSRVCEVSKTAGKHSTALFRRAGFCKAHFHIWSGRFLGIASESRADRPRNRWRPIPLARPWVDRRKDAFVHDAVP